MFDLSINSYNKVIKFLEQNIEKRDTKPCVPIDYNPEYKDLYELIIVTIDYEYFDDPNKNFYNNDVIFEKCYYYLLKYNDDSYDNELSVIDCGGYFIAVCIFKNKINITNESIYKKEIDGNNTFQKFHMNTIIGNKYEKIEKKNN